MKKILFILIVFYLTTPVSSINFKGGYPFITNYSKKDYKVSNNNHAIIQDQRGVLYFANDFGILEFDGHTWSIIQVASNHSNIKSLAFDNHHRLYVGAQGDIGYLSCQVPHGLIFKSLVNKIPVSKRGFGDVENTFVLENSILFHSHESIFVYANDTISVYELDGGCSNAFQVQDRIIVQGVEGLFEYQSEGLTPFLQDKRILDAEIANILPAEANRYIIVTRKKGLFLLEDGKLFSLQVKPQIDFSMVNINTAVLSRDGEIVIGTNRQGLYFISQEGRILEHLNNTKGLQSNEIESLFFDQSNNLWITNNKGVDFVEVASPFSRFTSNMSEGYNVYDVTVFHNYIYLATHNGLKLSSVKYKDDVFSLTNTFKNIDGADDINWKLTKINDRLFACHDNGFSEVKDGKVLYTVKCNGGWTLQPISDNDERLIGGTYTGLVSLVKVNGRYQLEHEIEGFGETCRLLEVDSQGNVWMAHGYKGIYKIMLSEDFKKVVSVAFYDKSKGLPDNLYNSVLKIDDEIIFGTSNGLYFYDAENDTMLIHKELTELAGTWHNGQFIEQDDNKNVWFVTENSAGIIKRFAGGGRYVEQLPLLKLTDSYIPGFISFELLKNGSALIGSNNGLVFYNDRNKDLNPKLFQVFIRNVNTLHQDKSKIYSDRIDYLCDTLKQEGVKLPYDHNSLHFDFATGFYENIEHIRFKVYLEGYDKDWSSWQPDWHKEYTNLREGDYVFRVKAQNIYHTVSDEVKFRFTILPPWYRTIYAYAVYVMLILLLLWLVIKIRTIRIYREKESFIQEQKREREIEQLRFKEEKLNDELFNKNQELSGLAMKVIYKNEKLSELKEKVSSIEEMTSGSISTKINALLKFIDAELNEDNWADFEMRFDLAHNNFLKRLKSDYPDLTSKDLKTCAYLRMNLSTKEIARLLNMTVRGVETARYRIRKRIGLDSTDNLTDFILTY